MTSLKSFLIIVLFSMPIINTLAQASGHQHGEHLSELLAHYMAVKDALAEDDFDAAQSQMTKFRKEVINSDEMNNHEEHAHMHAKHHDAMVHAVEVATQADDIKKLRMAFKDISEHLAMALENQGYNTNTLYLQYCPMAAGGEGAHWISDQKKILNPYMGQKMPECGENKKEID